MDITEENIDNQLMEEDDEENIDNQLMEEDEKEIKINSDQKIRGATGLKVIQKLNLLVQYYSELENMLGSLDQYIICEKHYNQVIRNNNFIKRLQNNLQFSTSINKEFNSFKEELKKITNQLNE
ncbi:7930_t:CDS:2, partial [Gigaspora margarita]